MAVRSGQVKVVEVKAAGTPSKQKREEEAETLVTGLAKKLQSTDEIQHKETVSALVEKQISGEREGE